MNPTSLKKLLQIIVLSGIILIVVVVGVIATNVNKAQFPETGLMKTTTPTGISSNPSVPNLLAHFLPFVFYNSGPVPTNTSTPVPFPTGLAEWSQLGGNAQHTGYISTTVQAPWKVKWIWNGPAGGGDSGLPGDHLALPKDVQPVVGDGMLFIGHSDGFLLAISQATGSQVWSANLGNPIMNTAAYDPESNSVYAGTSDGRFWRLDASNGQVVRSNRPGGQVLMAPLLVGDKVFVGSNDGSFYAFDKLTLSQDWSYNAGAALIASPAYSPNHGGLIILEVEDKSVQAVHINNGTRAWRVVVNADVDPKRNTVFADTYPVVSNVNDVVIVRSYLNWTKIWKPDGGAPSTVDEIRTYLTQNPTYQSFFVLNLIDGSQKYVAPVMLGAIGNGGDLASTPPQAVVKRLPDGSEVAYVLWRTRQACISYCDGREDTTLGEMDLTNGNIRFVQSYKNQGDMRLPTDEQSPLSMAGNSLFYAHWMLLGALQITDRSATLGGTYANPIKTSELTPVLNTLAAGTCSNRSGHFCPTNMNPPCDTYGVDPGFYIYYSSTCAYNTYFSTPVRNAVISDNTIYWKSVDGAIIALVSK
jgi:outer membrane protein assembly factor BamB